MFEWRLETSVIFIIVTRVLPFTPGLGRCLCAKKYPFNHLFPEFSPFVGKEKRKSEAMGTR